MFGMRGEWKISIFGKTTSPEFKGRGVKIVVLSFRTMTSSARLQMILSTGRGMDWANKYV